MTVTSSAESMVVIGQIGAPYGIKGWVHVRSFTEPASNIAKFVKWQLSSNNCKLKKQFISVEHVKAHNDHWVAKLENVEDRNIAASITNLQIAVNRNEFADLDEGEYYWADLIGASVYNICGKQLGEVTELLATGANDVLVIKQEEKEILIPYVDKYIEKVSVDPKEITVNWNEDD